MVGRRETCNFSQKEQVFWFGLDKCRVPTKTTLSLPLLNWTGERKYDEKVEIRTGRDHLPITVMDKMD